MKTNWWDRAAVAVLVASVLGIIAFLILALTLPDDPNTKTCPVISGIAFCEEN